MVLFFSLDSIYTLESSEVITLLSAFITGGVAAIGAILAVSLDCFRARRERKNNIRDGRNLFRTDVLKYLEGRRKELMSLLDEAEYRNVTYEFIIDILEKFNNKFFSDILLENKKVYKKINEFIDEIEALLKPSENETTQKCLNSINTLITYLRDELKKARRK